MKKSIALFVIGLAIVLAACATPAPSTPAASQAGVQVSDPWVRAASATGTSDTTSAAYMVIKNTGVADRLLKAQSDAAKNVEIHSTTMENNVMKMSPVNGIDVPANGQAALAPGGFHVMMIGITRDLKAGDTVNLTLTFEKAGTVQVNAPVRQP